MIEAFSRFDALVFDCDGTLLDTMPKHFIAWRETLARYGIGFPEDRFYSLGGVPAPAIVAQLAAENGVEVDAEAVADEKESLFVELVGASIGRIEPVVAIAESFLGKRPLAVATGSPTWLAERMLKAAGVYELFVTIVGADQVKEHKPHPETYLEACRRLGVAPERACGFEDTDLGMESIRRAGMEAFDIRRLLECDERKVVNR